MLILQVLCKIKLNIFVYFFLWYIQSSFSSRSKLTYILISKGKIVYILDFKCIIFLTFLDFPQHDSHFEGGVSQESSQSVFLCDFLYQAPSASKLSSEKKLLEGIFSPFRFYLIKLYFIIKTIRLKCCYFFSP